MLRGMRMFGSLFLLGLAIRSIQYPRVFSGVGVQLPYAGDAYYHLRRIWYSVARFPEALPFDRYVSFPDGAQIHWPSAFDWTIAALIRPFVDPTDQGAVEALAVWVPAVLGGAVSGLLALGTERLYGRAAGWCAGLVYSALPISFVYSQLGMIDHHVAIALLSTVMLWLASWMFCVDDRAHSGSAALHTRSTHLAVALGLSMAITVATWPGALLHVAVIQVAMGARWLLAEDREVARARAIAFAIAQAVLAACIAPFGLGAAWRDYGAWSPLVLSNFQPAYYGCAAAAVFIAQLLHERSALGASLGRRVASCAALGGVGLLAALGAVPPLREAIFYAAGWFAQGEELLGIINEVRPILTRAGHFDLNFPLERFGAGFVAFPLVWLALAWRAVRGRSAPHGLVLFWALAFFVLTLRQWRFGNTLGVVYAGLIGAVLADWLMGLRGRIASRPLRSVLEMGVAAILVGWTLVAWTHFYRPLVSANLAALAPGPQQTVSPLPPGKQVYDEAGRWMARNTPKTSGYLDREAQPEYGVLCEWSVGHLLRYRSERPMVQDNFGPFAGRESFESAWAYFEERDEAAAIAILERLRVRYVVSGLAGAGSLQGLRRNAMAYRLGRALGSRTQFRRGRSLLGLSRHRLIHLTQWAPRGLPQQRPGKPGVAALGIWEIVSGAQIVGRADPGARVDLRLHLEMKSNARHVYRRMTLADERGEYRFVVPYPTDLPYSPAVRVIAAYRLRRGETVARVPVREEDVRSGAVVRGPDL